MRGWWGRLRQTVRAGIVWGRGRTAPLSALDPPADRRHATVPVATERRAAAAPLPDLAAARRRLATLEQRVALYGLSRRGRRPPPRDDPQ